MNNLMVGFVDNQNQKKQGFGSLDKVAESWVRLCLFHLKHKKQLSNQYKTKYEYKAT